MKIELALETDFHPNGEGQQQRGDPLVVTTATSSHSGLCTPTTVYVLVRRSLLFSVICWNHQGPLLVSNCGGG